MYTYLLGLTIDCLAFTLIVGYLVYSQLSRGKLLSNFEKRALIIVGTALFLIIVVSFFLVRYDNLLPATIMIWMSAVPLLVTGVFILLIILFKPGWK